MATEVLNRQRLVRLDPKRVARLADAVLGSVGKPEAELSVSFVRDRAMRGLNRKHRNTNRTTDVLSFPMQERGTKSPEAFATGHIGDVIISTETALRQANEAGHSVECEIDELIIHGVLHLCGYDHSADDGQMNRLELRLRVDLLEGET